MLKQRLGRLKVDQHFRLFSGGLALRLAGMPLSFLAGVWIARQLGASEFGAFSFAMSVASLLCTPFVGGLATYLLREQSKAHHDGDWLRIRGLSASVTAAVLGWSLLVGLGGLAFVLLADLPQSGMWLLTFLLIPLLGQNSARTQALRAIDRPMLSMALDQLLNPAIKLVLLAAAYLAGVQLAASSAMGIQLLAALGAFLVGSYFLITQFRRHAGGKPEVRPLTILGDARPLMVLAVVQVIAAQTAVQLLNLMSEPAQVGAYRAAEQLAIYVAFGLPLVNTLFAPQLAKAIKASDRAALQELATKNAILALSISVPAAVVLIALPGTITDVLYGQSFREQGTQEILPILAAAYLANALGGSNGAILNMGGQESHTIKVVLWTTLLVVIPTALMFVPSHGAKAMAFAMLAYYVTVNIVLTYIVRVRYSVDTTFLSMFTKPGSRK